MLACAGVAELPETPAMLLMEDDDETVDRELVEGLFPANAVEVDATGVSRTFK